MARKGESGYVYIMSNPCIKYLKIGHSKHDPHSRLAKLSNGTWLPDPFEIEYSARVNGCREVEREVHRYLKPYHYKKEFFDVTIQSAINIIEKYFDVVDATNEVDAAYGRSK